MLRSLWAEHARRPTAVGRDFAAPASARVKRRRAGRARCAACRGPAADVVLSRIGACPFTSLFGPFASPLTRTGFRTNRLFLELRLGGNCDTPSAPLLLPCAARQRTDPSALDLYHVESGDGGRVGVELCSRMLVEKGESLPGLLRPGAFDCVSIASNSALLALQIAGNRTYLA